MAWFLRAFELETGGWACRWGDTEFDQHADLTDACAHLRSTADEIGPSRIFVHSLDGTVSRLDDSPSTRRPQGLGPG